MYHGRSNSSHMYVFASYILPDVSMTPSNVKRDNLVEPPPVLDGTADCVVS